MAGQQRETDNRILQSLSRETFERLKPSFRTVDLPHGLVLSHEYEEVDDVYFLERGLVSIVQRMEDGRIVEVGAIGVNGVTNSFSLCGLGSPGLEYLVQVPVSAIRVHRDVLLDEMSRDGLLKRLIQNYGQFSIEQIARTAACNRLHTITQRSCLWLLTAHDCARADFFDLTHEFLAEMLGVQRSGVSAIASGLRNSGMIAYRHGKVRILDRQALEDGTCECYFDTRMALDRVFVRALNSSKLQTRR